MNDSAKHQRLLDLFESAVDSRMNSDDSHSVDDDELLISWSVGELDKDQHAALIEHMAECSYCRREVAAMVKAEVLLLPDVEEVQEAVELAPAAVSSRKPNWALWTTLAAITAVLMLIVGSEPTAGPLTIAQRELEAGNAQAAMIQLEELLDAQDKLSPKIKTQAHDLLQQAGYKVALDYLDGKNFPDVLDVEERVSSRVGVSPELLNLKLQAERRVPDEFSLAMNDSLSDYGYQLNGTAATKAFPTIDEIVQRLNKEFEQAVAEYPDDIRLHLNYGHFLLEQFWLDEARQQFNAVLVLERRSTLAHLGLGLIAFELEQFTDALKQFEAALQIDAANPNFHINAAICLKKLGRASQARDHWQKAAKLTTDRDLRKSIEEQISPSN